MKRDQSGQIVDIRQLITENKHLFFTHTHIFPSKVAALKRHFNELFIYCTWNPRIELFAISCPKRAKRAIHNEKSNTYVCMIECKQHHPNESSFEIRVEE